MWKCFVWLPNATASKYVHGSALINYLLSCSSVIRIDRLRVPILKYIFYLFHPHQKSVVSVTLSFSLPVPKLSAYCLCQRQSTSPLFSRSGFFLKAHKILNNTLEIHVEFIELSANRTGFFQVLRFCPVSMICLLSTPKDINLSTTERQ
jgi:hypothetical protein